MINHLLRCWGYLSLLNWIEAYVVSIVNTANNEIGDLIYSVKFLSSEVL